jgi:hypothetical protein
MPPTMITLMESERKSRATRGATENFGYLERIELSFGFSEVAFERHDAGLLRRAEELVEHRQQVRVVALGQPGFITSPICLSSFITVGSGVPMRSWPTAAPK